MANSNASDLYRFQLIMQLITRRTLLHVLLPLLFLFPAVIFGQTATVEGTVRDTTGRVMENAVVGYPGIKTSSYSDASGKYSVVVPTGKPLFLIVRSTGYIEFKKEINPNSGEVLHLDVILRKKSVVGDTFSKVEDRGKLDAGRFIPPRIFDHLPSASQDISAMLRFAGAQSSNELSTQYSVRGGSFDENLVYVNDIEVYRPFLTRSGQQEGLSFVNVDMTDNVFFSAGGFEAKYGDKMASVLDIKYRVPTKFAGVASASLLGFNAEVEGVSKDYRTTWMIGIRNKSNRYLLRSLDVAGDYTSNFTDVQGILTHNFTDEWTLTYLGNYAVNKYSLIPTTRETDFGTLNNALRFTVYFDGREFTTFNTMFHALSLDYKRAKWHVKFSASSFNSYETETFDVQGQYYIDQLEADFGKPTFGQVAFNRGVGTFLNHARNYLNAWVNNGEVKAWYTTEKSVLNFGARYQNERITDEISEWNMVDSAGYSIPYLPINSIDLQDVVKTNAQFYSNRVMAFAQYKYFNTLKDSSEISLTVGVRGQYWDMNGQTIVSPRVQFAWKPYWKKDSATEPVNISFRAAIGFYDQPPFYRELRDYNGNINRDIQAQHAIHAIVGSDLTFDAWGRPFRFIAEAYYKYFDKLIPYEVNDVRIRYFGDNLAYGNAYGLDLRMNGEFVQGVESWINVSFLRIQENLYNDNYYIYTNSDGDTIVPGFTLNSTPTDSILQVPGFIPRPTDQLMTFALYFQDHLPKYESFKMNLGLILGTGLPFGPPNHKRYQQVFRMPPYRRVDIGFSYQVFSEEKPLKNSSPFHFMKSLWIGAEVYNLLQTPNTISYYWIKDVTGRTYAVPNYLTNRQLSVRVILHF